MPVPRSIRRSTTLLADSLEDGSLDRLFGNVQPPQLVPALGDLGEIRGGLCLLRPARTASSRSRSRAAGRDRWDRAARRASARARPHRPRRAGNRPMRLRRCASTRPASASSFRWRETRGWLCPRISVRSLTECSPSARSASSRSRVLSPAARNAPTNVAESAIRPPLGYKDIFICAGSQGFAGSRMRPVARMAPRRRGPRGACAPR